MTTINDYARCDHCWALGPISIWLPGKYRQDNWCPSSFSSDELIYACEDCTREHGYNHDRVDKPKPKPKPKPKQDVPAKPYRWL